MSNEQDNHKYCGRPRSANPSPATLAMRAYRERKAAGALLPQGWQKGRSRKVGSSEKETAR